MRLATKQGYAGGEMLQKKQAETRKHAPTWKHSTAPTWWVEGSWGPEPHPPGQALLRKGKEPQEVSDDSGPGRGLVDPPTLRQQVVPQGRGRHTQAPRQCK